MLPHSDDPCTAHVMLPSPSDQHDASAGKYTFPYMTHGGGGGSVWGDRLHICKTHGG